MLASSNVSHSARFSGDASGPDREAVFMTRRDRDQDRVKRIIKSQVQAPLGERFNAYFWKAYKHPGHWDVYLAHKKITPQKPDWDPGKLQAWFQQNRKDLETLFKERVEPLVGEVYLIARPPLGKEPGEGGCCGTGCGGCLIGKRRLDRNA